MNIAVIILAILFFVHLMSYVLRRINIPYIVSLILSGVLVGLPIIKNSLTQNNKEIIFILGDIALIGLMFVAGLESSWKELYSEKKDAMIIAIFAFLVPFLLSFFIFRLIGFSLVTSLFVGICLSITAEATKAQVLIKLKKLKTKVGSAMMGAGILDDFLGLSFFIILSSIITNTFDNIFLFGTIISFIAGILVQKHLKRDSKFVTQVEKTIFWAIFPFFFVSVGIYFDITSITITYLMPLIISIAIFGKISGVLFTRFCTNFNLKQLHLIGWSMNSRGAIEIALALIAYKNNFISYEIYSALIITAIVTTIIFPIILKKQIQKFPKIMN